MWKLRVITLVSLLLAAVAVGCTSSSLTDIETLATSDISVEDAAEATVKAMETQESLYATSTAVAQDNAVEATVKAKEIEEAVDATLEAKRAGETPTAPSGSAPPVVTTGPTHAAEDGFGQVGGLPSVRTCTRLHAEFTEFGSSYPACSIKA